MTPNQLANSFAHVPRQIIEQQKLHMPDFIAAILPEGVWLDDVFIVSRQKADALIRKYASVENNPPASETQAVTAETQEAAALDNSILRPIKNFAGSMKNWVINGLPVASKEVYDMRKSICDNCPFWDKDGNMGMGKCNQCGCTAAKLHLATEKCPIDKWGPETKD